MGFWDHLRGKPDSASEGLNPIVQRVPMPAAAPPRPSAARPAAKPAAPALPPAPVTKPPAAKELPSSAVTWGGTRDIQQGFNHFRRGLARQAEGDHVGAVEEFTKAIERDAGCVDAYASRGISREFLGDLAGAKADYTKSIELEVRAEISKAATQSL